MVRKLRQCPAHYRDVVDEDIAPSTFNRAEERRPPKQAVIQARRPDGWDAFEELWDSFANTAIVGITDSGPGANGAASRLELAETGL